MSNLICRGAQAFNGLLGLFGNSTVVKMFDASWNERTNTSHEMGDFDERGFHVSGRGRLCPI
jgi:hypothetical protein